MPAVKNQKVNKVSAAIAKRIASKLRLSLTKKLIDDLVSFRSKKIMTFEESMNESKYYSELKEYLKKRGHKSATKKSTT